MSHGHHPPPSVRGQIAQYNQIIQVMKTMKHHVCKATDIPEGDDRLSTLTARTLGGRCLSQQLGCHCVQQSLCGVIAGPHASLGWEISLCPQGTSIGAFPYIHPRSFLGQVFLRDLCCHRTMGPQGLHLGWQGNPGVEEKPPAAGDTALNPWPGRWSRTQQGNVRDTSTHARQEETQGLGQGKDRGQTS